MGRSVKPSCKNTTGIGPAIDRRRARRTGTDAVPVRAMRAAGVGHSPPIKKPAAMDAAGFDQGHGSGVRRRAFQRRTVRLRPPFHVAGGVACGAEVFRVVLAHSLLQGTSAGRNLITVFSTVNNLSQSFSRVPARCSRRHASMRVGCAASTHRLQPQRRCIDALHASNGAACSACGRNKNGIAACMRACTQRIRMRACERRSARAERRAACRDFAPHKSVCAKTAQDFSAPRARRCSLRALRGCRKRRTRDVAVAGSWSPDGGADQWSSSSSNSA